MVEKVTQGHVFLEVKRTFLSVLFHGCYILIHSPNFDHTHVAFVINTSKRRKLTEFFVLILTFLDRKYERKILKIKDTLNVEY